MHNNENTTLPTAIGHEDEEESKGVMASGSILLSQMENTPMMLRSADGRGINRNQSDLQ